MSAAGTLERVSRPVEVVGALLYVPPDFGALLMEVRAPHELNAGERGFFGGRVDNELDGPPGDPKRYQNAIERELGEELGLSPGEIAALGLWAVRRFRISRDVTGRDELDYHLFRGNFPPHIKVPEGPLREGNEAIICYKQEIFVPDFPLTKPARYVVSQMQI